MEEKKNEEVIEETTEFVEEVFGITEEEMEEIEEIKEGE